jgi:hypothetical protein
VVWFYGIGEPSREHNASLHVTTILISIIVSRFSYVVIMFLGQEHFQPLSRIIIFVSGTLPKTVVLSFQNFSNIFKPNILLSCSQEGLNFVDLI